MRTAALLLVLAGSVTFSQAQTKDWLPTWGTAEMVLPAAADAAKTLPIGKQAISIRQVVHISQGGKRMRVTFTNEFGTTPLRIDAAHVAFLSAGSKILPATDRPLTFSGQSGLTIAPGQFASSDAVVETVPIFSDLVITALLPAQELPVITYHAAAHTTTFIAPGDMVTAEQFLSPTTLPPGLSAPDVAAPVAAPLGDKSIVQSVTSPKASGGLGKQSEGGRAADHLLVLPEGC